MTLIRPYLPVFYSTPESPLYPLPQYLEMVINGPIIRRWGAREGKEPELAPKGLGPFYTAQEAMVGPPLLGGPCGKFCRADIK